MKTDSQIQKDVMEQLRWEPFIESTEIGVAVKNGIVTLTGHVDTYPKKLAAENAAKKVTGVKAIAEDIQVDVSPAHKKNDTEIAEAVLNALKWHSALQQDRIQIKVENGRVTLEGEVEWAFQRTSAKTAIENLTGVRSIINAIAVKPSVTPTDIRQKIQAAFHRSATIDADKIVAEVHGNKITLRGTVRSYAEKEDAATAAWNAPGISVVKNELEIETPQYEVQD